jgi:hypothetical protein
MNESKINLIYIFDSKITITIAYRPCKKWLVLDPSN